VLYRLSFWVIVLFVVGMLTFVVISPTFDLVRFSGERVVTGVKDLRGR
jgi:hypothetical protein